MKFAYTAISKDGKTLHGTAETADKQALTELLTKQGVRPLVIKETATRQFNFGGKRVRVKDLVIFTRQLSTMISAGVSLTRALVTLQEQAESKYLRKVLEDITREVEGGKPLGDTFAKYPNVFSEVYVNMVRAGEAGGILDEILKRLAAQVEQDASMRKKIKSAMTYPVVILGITVLAFFGIMFFVIPKLGEILTELGGPDAELPVYTQALLSISGFMQANAVVILAVLGIGTFALRRYVKTPAGKYRFHSLLLRLPFIKNIVTKIAIARFARTFASLMSSGVSMLDCLRVTGGAVGNKVIEAELAEAAKAVKNGQQLSEPLSQSVHFPPIVAQMLTVGEETGQIDTILLKVADFYEEDVHNTIEALSSLIEPLMIIVLGGMVGVIAASVMGPIASLSQNVGG